MSDRYAEKLLTMCRFGDSLAELGTDSRIRVGAVVFPVDCSAAWGIGYNGAASGLDHGSVMRTAGELGTGASGSAHAEANALLKAGDRAMGRPCLIYSSLAPCPYCAPLIINTTGIVGVIVGESRHDVRSGLGIVESAGVPVVLKSDLEDALLGHASPGVAGVIQWWRSMRPTRMRMPSEGDQS